MSLVILPFADTRNKLLYALLLITFWSCLLIVPELHPISGLSLFPFLLASWYAFQFQIIVLFFCSGLSKWSSLWLFHLLQFSLMLASLSETVYDCILVQVIAVVPFPVWTTAVFWMLLPFASTIFYLYYLTEFIWERRRIRKGLFSFHIFGIMSHFSYGWKVSLVPL